jgi:hypothetical protein
MSYVLQKRGMVSKVFKGSTRKFTWSGGEIPHIGMYGGLIWHVFGSGIWMHE